MAKSHELGKTGEYIAAQYLLSSGYRLIDTNWRCHLGEIDIIAQQGSNLYFFEVKTRSSQYFGGAKAAISQAKNKRLGQLCHWWLIHYPAPYGAIQLGLIAIEIDNSGQWNLEIIPMRQV